MNGPPTSFRYTRNKPLVAVVLHGKFELTQRMLVDCGSDMVTVAPQVCRDLGWPRIGTRTVVVPGAVQKAPLYQGEIEFLGLRKSVEVQALDIPRLDYLDGLLGREVLDHFRVCLEWGRKVTFEPQRR